MQERPLGLSTLALRVGWGLQGNQAVRPYGTQLLLRASGDARYPFGTTLTTGLVASQVANPDLKWETSEQINFGIDYGFYSPLYGSLYYPYYYSPFAYSYYGRFDPRFFGGGVVVVPVIPDGGDGTTDPPASGAARAVDGLGYTRVRPRNEEPTVQSGRRIAPGRDAAATSTGSSGAASAPASSGSSGSPGGGAVSSGGFSSGGGSDSGRTAVPR